MENLSDVLKVLGPNAAIVFAAWIFMGFLQQRSDNAIDRFRASVDDYRSNDHKDERAGDLKAQVLSYRRRCKIMERATLSGLIAAILLISSLILGSIDALVPKIAVIKIAGTVAALGGFAMVIVAACLVIADGRIVNRQLDTELEDVPDLKNG